MSEPTREGVAASGHPLMTADCFRHGEFDARLFRCPMCAAEREDVVLGKCVHGVDLDREFCPEGCRV